MPTVSASFKQGMTTDNSGGSVMLSSASMLERNVEGDRSMRQD